MKSLRNTRGLSLHSRVFAKLGRESSESSIVDHGKVAFWRRLHISWYPLCDCPVTMPNYFTIGTRGVTHPLKFVLSDSPDSSKRSTVIITC